MYGIDEKTVRYLNLSVLEQNQEPDSLRRVHRYFAPNTATGFSAVYGYARMFLLFK